MTAVAHAGLPAQGVGPQPDQHHRQRGLCRTDGAYYTVRRGAAGWLIFFASCLVFAWMWGVTDFPGLIAGLVFCNGIMTSFFAFSGCPDLHMLTCSLFMGHGAAPFFSFCLFVVCVCVCVCVCAFVDLMNGRIARIIPPQT